MFQPAFRYFVCLLCLIGPSILLMGAFSQTQSQVAFDPDRKIARAQLLEDFIYFRRALETAHASLYRYTSKEAMDARFDIAFKSIDRDLTVREFYQLLAWVRGAIKDGHTAAYLPKEFRTYMAQGTKLFPLTLRFINGSAYVIGSPVAEVPAGCQLLSIDGRPMSQVINKLFQYLVADGDIQTGKYWNLNEQFGYLYYLFGEQPISFNVVYKNQSGKEPKSAKIPALTQIETKELLKQTAAKADKDKQKPLRLEWLKELNTALLTIETFNDGNITNAGQDFAQFLKTSFQQIRDRKVQDLIIDLRGNDGGNPYGPLLFSYLTDKSFRFVDYIEAATNNPRAIYNDPQKNASAFQSFIDSVAPDGKGRFRVKPETEPALSLQRPSENAYSSRVWFIVNGETFSSTAEFCDIARSNGRGFFVGEETGGAYYGNSAGEFAVIQLPETKISIVIPLEQYVMAVAGHRTPGHGVLPDYPIQPTISDLLAGRDTELNYTLELIKKTGR